MTEKKSGPDIKELRSWVYLISKIEDVITQGILLVKRFLAVVDRHRKDCK